MSIDRSGTRFPGLFAALAAPFHESEVRTRQGGGGRQLSYITARVAANRLDEVVGPENWRCRHRLEHLAGGIDLVICTIEINVDDEWVAKEDAGGFKEMQEKSRNGQMVEDDENTVKTAFSDAFKRCASVWGVGRYLYGDGPPIYGNEHVAAPAPAPASHPQGRNSLHPNNSGHHNGQYASPENTQKYLDRLRDKVDLVNGQWGDFWIDRHTGELPDAKECQKELMSAYKADGHLVKWLVETNQIDQDALEKNGKPSMLGRHAAIVLTRSKSDAAAMARELDRYIAQVFNDTKEAVYRKHPDLAPDGWAAEQAEADDEPVPEAEPEAHPIPSPYGDGPPPATGAELLDWAKLMEQRFDFGLPKYLGGWGRLRRLPLRVDAWPAEQVAAAHQEALRKLRAVAAERGAEAAELDRGDAYEGPDGDDLLISPHGPGGEG